MRQSLYFEPTFFCHGIPISVPLMSCRHYGMEDRDSTCVKSIALIDKDKKESYSSEPDIYFTKANDYEEDVYDNFKLTDYLKSCKELSGVEPYIPILRREGLNFNPGQFVENPVNIEIDDTLQMKIMVENKDRELQKLKQSKNAAKGAVLAGYVTVIPPAFEKIINKLIKEVK